MREFSSARAHQLGATLRLSYPRQARLTQQHIPLTTRLRAIHVPLPRASEGHSGPLVTAKPEARPAHTQEFGQFPSGQCGFDSRHPLHTRKALQDRQIGLEGLIPTRCEDGHQCGRA